MYISAYLDICCCEYENGYDSVYEGVYDQNFVYEDDEESESFDDYSDELEYEDDDAESEDVILEEVPFVYCPTRGETGEA